MRKTEVERGGVLGATTDSEVVAKSRDPLGPERA
jgi:hypothetical protein